MYDDITRKQIKYDNAVQSIISGSLYLETKAYLIGCRTAYQMIDRLKKTTLQIRRILIKFINAKNQNFRN